MPYPLQSQIPELSVFSRPQRRFLVREALILLKRDDPWFYPCMVLLGSGMAAGALSFSFLFLPIGETPPWIFVYVLAPTLTMCGEALCAHIFHSHLRQFLREAIDKNGSTLDEIGS